jgi:hypothetical protein
MAELRGLIDLPQLAWIQNASIVIKLHNTVLEGIELVTC